ncbi:MAG TPA: OsmC family protein [Segeticoccus sp.]|uniref:OsmC family protein n=1 Tax=Segeticoccus sp. TaxID=2706531 RepID=UPI002D8018E7|nr:OsmC family protein [Segeticoccus sp.]HET8601261.1 OsmC family protein [Segeticoccus sp.]
MEPQDASAPAAEQQAPPPEGRRAVTIHRTGPTRYRAVNARGGEIEFSHGADEQFTPVELLLVAVGGCTSVDVDILTSRRAEPESFEVLVEGEKVRDDEGNHLSGVEVTFRIRFPEGGAGDEARRVLPDAVQRSHERLCTVSRTVELPTPVEFRIAGD